MAIILDGVTFKEKKKDTVKTIKEREYFDMGETTGEHDFVEGSELGDSLKELNKDSIQQGTKMSAIDMRSRLHYMEIGSILAIDTLVAFQVLPKQCLAYTLQKKRIQVSLDGKGRTEIVDIVAGKRQQDTERNLGGFDKIKNMLLPKPKNEN